MLNLLYVFYCYINSIPARLRGAKIGSHVTLEPGYTLATTLNGLKISNNVFIGRNARFLLLKNPKSSAQILVGNNTVIGPSLTIACTKNVTIGNNCLLSYNVSLVDHEHEYNGISQNNIDYETARPISIGDNCFVGAHSFILKGVILGKNCIVGANSVVTKSFPNNCKIAGSPAKII